MRTLVLHFATVMLIMGYLIHAINFQLLHMPKMCAAMVLFAMAMYFLFT